MKSAPRTGTPLEWRRHHNRQLMGDTPGGRRNGTVVFAWMLVTAKNEKNIPGGPWKPVRPCDPVFSSRALERAMKDHPGNGRRKAGEQ